MLFALKLCLVPVLVGAVTLATRRWGPRIGGWLTALPVIAGPTLCFYAIEQGSEFARRAAGATLVGLVDRYLARRSALLASSGEPATHVITK